MKKENGINVFSFIFKYFKKYKFILITLFTLWALFSITFDSLISYTTKVLIDNLVEVSNNNNITFSTVKEPVILLIIEFIFTALVIISSPYITFKSIKAIENEIREDLFLYLQKHSLSYFSSNFGGDISAKVNNIADSSSAILRIIVNNALPVFTSLLFSFYMFTRINHTFSLILIIWTIIFVISMLFLYVKQAKYSEKVANAKTAFVGSIVDTISNISLVKGFAREKFEINNIKNKKNIIYLKQRSETGFSTLVEFVRQLLTIIIFATLILMSIYFKVKNLITIGDIIFIISAGMSVVYGMNWISSQISELFSNVGTVKDGLGKIFQKHSILDCENAKKLEIQNGKIEIKNLLFIYKE